ncbi:MAG: hypothetical protein JWM95_5344 [Gemmatimonadetes bacterium]|nr:hypothetical protein [Gemmatimonadota bacterium]
MSAQPNSAPASDPSRPGDGSSSIAGTVLPIQKAEELLATLPGVLNVRIIPAENGEVAEVHVLTTTEVSPKQTVRNVESALLAQLGMRVSHKKISVATSEGPAAEAMRASRMTPMSGVAVVRAPEEPMSAKSTKRRLYFEDVEITRSRKSGMTCSVTLRRGEEMFVGEATGQSSDRLRAETSAKAACAAIQKSEADGRALVFEGAKTFEAFEREFVFVALTTRSGHDSALLTGSAEIKDGIETASVLAVLDATNRWVEF